MLDKATEVSHTGRALTRSLVDAAAVEAVGVVVQTMRNAKGESLRFQAARDLIQLSLADGDGAPGEAASEGAMLERIAGALQLRSRAAAAVDAVQVGGETVAPAAPAHSPKQPDTPSE